MFYNKVFGRVFGPKGDEVTGRWIKLHHVMIRNLYTSRYIIRMIKSRKRWAGYVARMGEKKNMNEIIVVKPHGRKQL
jgi:hypothetical protein